MSYEADVIRVERVCKSYLMFGHPRDRLKQFVIPRLQRLLGRPPRRYFTEFNALSDVSFRVGRGETVGVIGRNGSGKSTLLQVLCGTLAPTSGNVEVKGRVAALLELGSGFNPDFSGRENVYLNAAILGLGAGEIESRFADIVSFADIGEFLDQPVKTYSSGMVVRLAFATAIHVDPDVLVVDEALAVGDVAFQQKCLDRIRQLQRHGVSILLVTHSTNALIEYCDRAIFLKHGQVVMDGACREVVKAYADDLVSDEGGEIEVPPPLPTQVADDNRTSLACATAKAEGSHVVPIAVEAVELLDADGLACSTLEYNGRLRVRVYVRVAAPITQPCFGIQISSVDGITLWSTTTQTTAESPPALQPGTYGFEWELHTPFGGGRYVLAIGVGQIVNGEYRRTHRVGYAGHFDVLAQAHGGSGWLAPSPLLRMPVAFSP